jgi:tetratricopeptide (TPR) repeat protein
MLAALLFLTVTTAPALPPADDYAALVARLEKPLVTKPETFRKLFLAMWAQVPNWKSGDPMWIRQPEPAWVPPPRAKGQPRAKRPPPHDPETLDWLAALASVDLDAAAQLDSDKSIPPPWVPPGTKVKKLPPPPVVADAPPPPPPPTHADMETARAEAIETVKLMRAIAASRRLEAVDPIFKLAFEYDGVFRDECGRAIRSMDSYAIPRLVELVHQPNAGKASMAKQRRYAAYQLDRMDRQRPQKAISTAPDDRVRAEIIHAYGDTRALDAVEAILGQVDSPAHRVRREARWAWLRYVSGKAPPPAPKRKRKLPGGKEEAEEKPDYLTYREIATLALQKELAAINNAPADPNATAAQLTDELFAYYDKKRAAEWDGQFAAAKAKEERGDVKGATDDYGWILAHDPNYARKSEMAHAFARAGDSWRDQGDVPRALGYWRQAIDLAPDGPDARSAAARVALYDGLEALAHGHADVGAFKRALALDPSLAEARTGLTRARWMQARRRWTRAALSLLSALGIAFALWLLWRRTSTARSAPTA